MYFVITFCALLLFLISFSLIKIAILSSNAMLDVYGLLKHDWENKEDFIKRLMESDSDHVKDFFDSSFFLKVYFSSFFSFFWIKKSNKELVSWFLINFAIVSGVAKEEVRRKTEEEVEKEIDRIFVNLEAMKDENPEAYHDFTEVKVKVRELFKEIPHFFVCKNVGGKPKRKINFKAVISTGRKPVFN